MTDPVLVWFRQDLRLADNPALTAAAQSGRPVCPVYILDTATGVRQMGAASRWWLHGSLAALQSALKARYGMDLILRRGDPASILTALIDEISASAVHWNRCYEPATIARDTAIKAMLKANGVAVETHNGGLLFEPWAVKTQAGGWFKVFTPFWRACNTMPAPPAPLPAPKRIAAPQGKIASDSLNDWQLRPTKPDWAGGLRQIWSPGEDAASRRIQDFLDDALPQYADARDRPAEAATSRISPHLHFGEISPRQIWHAVQLRGGDDEALRRHRERFQAELGWREFSHHLLFHFPNLPERNFRAEFDAFAWRDDPDALKAWQKGRTGFPIVDAGMRELWHTGWMHNRVRMIAASFLVKHLRQDWRQGEAWFWDTLVDADLANNAASWQWVAGSGADAAPYFRIFNPVLQGEKFDPEGAYVRRWIPEIAGLPPKYIHEPWQAPAGVLQTAKLHLGRDYPLPIIDLGAARQAALDAFAALRR